MMILGERLSDGRFCIGLEVKFAASPTVSRGFCQAARALQLDEACVVAPVAQAYPLQSDVWVRPVSDAALRLSGALR